MVQSFGVKKLIKASKWGFVIVMSLALVYGLDVLRGEVAHASMATSPPASWVRAVDEFNGIAALEVELRGVLRGEVEQSAGVVGALWEKTEGEEEEKHMRKT